LGAGEFEITSETIARHPLKRTLRGIRHLVIGDPLTSGREKPERLTWMTALAVLGADILASSVYGPEEMIRVLVEAGPGAAAGFVLPLAVAIVVLLAIWRSRTGRRSARTRAAQAVTSSPARTWDVWRL